MLVFGDVFFDIDIDRMEKFHKDKASLATLFVHPNSHPYDSDLIEADENSRVKRFDSKNNVRNYWYDNVVNAGLYIIDKSICDKVSQPVKTDFEKDILAKMALEGEPVYAYASPEYVKDVGTVDRITLEKSAAPAIGLINSSGYLAIVVTNQPSVARGLCQCSDIELIHKKMKSLLGKEGVYADEVYYCPHHPDKGFPEENPAYKIDCECRKPKIGMIDIAKERFNIDLSKSWIIGDSSLDMELGNRAGLKKALVLTGSAGKDGKYEFTPDITASDIKEAVEKILEIKR